MKKLVHYKILADMQKYIEGVNPDDYLSNFESTDPSIEEYVRDYYDNHLPVDINAWIRVNRPYEELIHAKNLEDQVRFVRDTLFELLTSNYEEWSNNPPLVIDSYYLGSPYPSRSLKIPVFQINLKKYGIEMVLRCNFDNWVISVKSDKPLDFEYDGLFDPEEELSHHYVYEFPKDKLYGSYEQNKAQFSIKFYSNYKLHTFIFLLKNYLGIKKEN